MNESFSFKEIRNCRRYIKRIYTLSRDINFELLNQLEVLGVLEIQKFSDYSELAKDTFKIRLDDEVEISGSINDTLCYVTLAKARPDFVEFVEDIFANWISQDRQKYGLLRNNSW